MICVNPRTLLEDILAPISPDPWVQTFTSKIMDSLMLVKGAYDRVTCLNHCRI